MNRTFWQIFVVVVGACLITYGVGYFVGRGIGWNVPVCHSVTEDSPIYDCEYHDGAWWRK